MGGAGVSGERVEGGLDGGGRCGPKTTLLTGCCLEKVLPELQ